ncbi:tripartite tricarboxylate transporter substrate binding protein [Aquabacterium sp. J223]|uniref:tripartite tricarboxylate transporter substrate binding protein n=1 Tax=Aquabacterium sp. J223 TaxID=2898431 RepID=UPI0021AD6B17|nr:tripartite tricarboxylate transporter substrate binding protein [Aquabacterium sp. J223]UUX94527.1 tripartite tricarboxylate transporter substrate binding protein [Aquabacterium sp. J223]
MDRRLALMALGTLPLGAAAQAQPGAFPGRPVRIVSAFSPGSGPDAMLRLVGERLSKAWGQPVTIDNRPGGGGFIAVAEVKKVPADGHTLLHADGLNFTAVPHLYKKLPYQVSDFDPVTPIHRSFFFIAVAANSPHRTLADLIAAAKARPNEVTYGSWQVGSVAHLSGAMLEAATGTRMNHIPFRDNAQLYGAVASGDVAWAFGSAGSTGPLQRAGKLRYLALAGPRRLDTHPDVPTVTEAGGPPQFEASGWVGLFAPRGTDRAVEDRLSADLAKALNDPAVRSKMTEFGYEPLPLSPADTAALVARESPRYAEIVKRDAIVLD